MKKTALALTFLFLTDGLVFAQSIKPTEEVKKPTETEKAEKAKQVKKQEKSKPATYFKVDVIHGDFGLYGHNFSFNDLGIGIEHQWSKRHLGLAGFAVGYRKEDFSSSNYGHFLNSKVFWKTKDKYGFYLKPGVGAEWGKPSPRFERTRFRYDGLTLTSYERVYQDRNAWMPAGIKGTGTLYPFFELGVGLKRGLFIFEGGARVGYNKFGIETFRFTNGDLTSQGLNKEHHFVTTIYIGIGLKMF